jgi:hypothetical protein
MSSNKQDRVILVVATFAVLCLFCMGYGIYKLINGNTGLDCEITLQFNDSKATYIGKTV